MFLKSSNILPLLNSEESSFDFSAAMLYLLVWWICVYSRKICEGLWCDWNEAETGDECLEAKVGWETHYHTTLQTSHTSLPLTHLSQQLQHQSLSFSLSSVSPVCLHVQCSCVIESSSCGSWELRLLVIPADACVFEVLWLQRCVWCSCFALLSTWSHTQGLFAAVSSTMSSVVNKTVFLLSDWFITLEMMTEILS